MKMFALAFGLLASTASFAYEISPVNLAYRAAGGAYESVEVVPGKTLGAGIVFCSRYQLFGDKVVDIVIEEAIAEGRLTSVDGGFKNALDRTLNNICIND